MIYCPVCEPVREGWIALMCVWCREKREAAQEPAPPEVRVIEDSP